MFEPYVQHAVFLVLLCSGVPLVFSSVTGLIIATLQAATQIQEQTITYLVKFLSVSAVLIITAEWFAAELVDFVHATLGTLSFLGKVTF